MRLNYAILHADSIANLESLVESWIEKGWTPQGNHIVIPQYKDKEMYYQQTMIFKPITT